MDLLCLIENIYHNHVSQLEIYSEFFLLVSLFPYKFCFSFLSYWFPVIIHAKTSPPWLHTMFKPEVPSYLHPKKKKLWLYEWQNNLKRKKILFFLSLVKGMNMQEFPTVPFIPHYTFQHWTQYKSIYIPKYSTMKKFINKF